MIDAVGPAWLRSWRAPALVVLLTAAAYATAPLNGFAWDDQTVIVKGRLIGSPRNIPAFFTNDAMWNSDSGRFARTATVDTYRPMALTSFALERAAFGLNPGPYHVTSVVIHLAVTLLVFHLGLGLGISRAAAAVGAALFGVHPSVSEAVFWINGRSDPFCVLFFVTAAVLTLRMLRLPREAPLPVLSLAGTALCALGSALSKETAFLLVIPAVLLLADRRPGARLGLAVGAAWAGGLGLGMAMRLLALGHMAASAGGAHLAYALPRVPAIWLDALTSFLLPRARLEPSLHEAYLVISLPRLLLAIGIAGLLAAASVIAWRRRGKVLYPWSLATAAIVLAPIALLTYSEGWSGWGRYLYPALFLPSLVAGHLVVDEALPRLRQRLRVALAASGGICLAALAVETTGASATWRNQETFALALIEDRPSSSVGYATLGDVMFERGRNDDALALFARATTIAPREPRYHAMQSQVLYTQGRYQEAWGACQSALRYNARHHQGRYMCALLLLRADQQEAAGQLLVGLLADDSAAEELWDTVREARSRLGPDSAFVATVRSLAVRPENAHMRARLLSML